MPGCCTSNPSHRGLPDAIPIARLGHQQLEKKIRKKIVRRVDLVSARSTCL
jgi:hypothetical protein